MIYKVYDLKRSYICLLLIITIRFTRGERKNLIKHQKVQKYYDQDCSYFAKLVISNAQGSLSYGGNDSTLNFIRLNYWIVWGSQIVKRSKNTFSANMYNEKTLLGPGTQRPSELRITVSILLEPNMTDQFILKITKLHVKSYIL